MDFKNLIDKSAKNKCRNLKFKLKWAESNRIIRILRELCTLLFDKVDASLKEIIMSELDYVILMLNRLDIFEQQLKQAKRSKNDEWIDKQLEPEPVLEIDWDFKLELIKNLIILKDLIVSNNLEEFKKYTIDTHNYLINQIMKLQIIQDLNLNKKETDDETGSTKNLVNEGESNVNQLKDIRIDSISGDQICLDQEGRENSEGNQEDNLLTRDQNETNNLSDVLLDTSPNLSPATLSNLSFDTLPNLSSDSLTNLLSGQSHSKEQINISKSARLVINIKGFSSFKEKNDFLEGPKFYCANVPFIYMFKNSVRENKKFLDFSVKVVVANLNWETVKIEFALKLVDLKKKNDAKINKFCFNFVNNQSMVCYHPNIIDYSQDLEYILANCVKHDTISLELVIRVIN